MSAAWVELVPIYAGSWFKSDVMEVINSALATGADPNISDAFTINGQPGDLYSCSKGNHCKLNHRVIKKTNLIINIYSLIVTIEKSKAYLN